MGRRTLIAFATVATLAVAATAAWPRIDFWTRTGHFAPIKKIETLQHPIAVTSTTPDGLILADGRTLPLPGLKALPKTSAAITAATKRGVEIDKDGRVWAIVRIHHWCGNDPVRQHEVRVDLSEMLTFLQIGEPTATVPEADFLATEPGGKFSEFGWDIGEFLQFQSWQATQRLKQ